MCKRVCARVCVYACLSVCLCVYACLSVRLCVSVRMCISVYASLRLCVCTYVRTRTYFYVCVCARVLYTETTLHKAIISLSTPFLSSWQSVVDKILKANVILVLTDPITRRDYLIEEICLKMRI